MEDAPKSRRWTREQLHGGATMLNLQTGTNQWDSQKGMTGFGMPRLQLAITKDQGYIVPDQIGNGILRGQYGSNQYASQKGMTKIGTGRTQVQPIAYKEDMKPGHDKKSETIVIGQAGSNKFASQAGEVVLFGKRNTKMFIIGRMIKDRRTDLFIPYQSGSNLYASQSGMMDPPGVGAFRNNTQTIEGLGFTEDELRKSAPFTPWLYGTNKFDSQRGTGGFLKVRDVLCKMKGGKEIPEEALMACEGFIRLQSGTNKLASQRGESAFGARRLEISQPKWKQEWIDEWEEAEREWEESGRGKQIDQQKHEQLEKQRQQLTQSASSQEVSEATEKVAEEEEEE